MLELGERKRQAESSQRSGGGRTLPVVPRTLRSGLKALSCSSPKKKTQKKIEKKKEKLKTKTKQHPKAAKILKLKLGEGN